MAALPEVAASLGPHLLGPSVVVGGRSSTTGGEGLVSGWLQGWRFPSFLFERAGSCHLNFQMSAVCSCNVTSSLLYHKPGVRVCVHRVCVHLGVRVCEGVKVSASQYVVCVVSVCRWCVHMRCGMCSHVHVCTHVLCVYVRCVHVYVRVYGAGGRIRSGREIQRSEGLWEQEVAVGTGLREACLVPII